MERGEMTQILRDAGCSEEEICLLMAHIQEPKKLLGLLAKHRSALLNEVHESERKIECLDYLVHQIKYYEKG